MDGEAQGTLRYDCFQRTCPSHEILSIVASKWVHLVICALRPGTMRYSDLQRRIEGVSPKMLTQTLRGLERDGLVRREIFASVPPRVDYTLTELGRELAGLLDLIREWSETRVVEIRAARARMG